ncbi:trypsin-like serine peptidase [Mesorhizobium onobrychidis]|uniref:Serine protease n=1 Tax=Mesorhizobium onobrychidis TaxID=2775404 RepID=A0ABY5R9M1_9HYPH|nr:trypsin-like peptidase domain-containing protein [Mesorhizobium onobrychidis]UVC19337.1 trypsin-like peptidase domain-containing protein [Mesorhizobium onobrychidis]
MAKRTYRKAGNASKPRPEASGAKAEREALILPSRMGETNGGGSPENVPGFDLFRAVTAGFETKRVAGATIVAAMPDGGFFSQGSGNPGPVFLGSPAAKPENVIGADNRTRVTDTAMTPWRCICHLEVEYESGPVGMGTGFLIGPHTVITAAHVLVDRRLFGWQRPRKAKRVRILPGRNGTLAPYGYVVTDSFEIPPEWTAEDAKEAAAPAFDFAAIRIPKTSENEVEHEALGARLGYFGLRAYTADEESEVDLLFVNNAGYPKEANKPLGTLWYNAGRISKWDKDFVEYMVDTEGGHSGSPIYYFDEKKQQRYVVAIHTTGDFVNRGLRITPAVFDRIRKWAQR